MLGRILLPKKVVLSFIQNDIDLKSYIYDALREVVEAKEIVPNMLTFGSSLISFNRPGSADDYVYYNFDEDAYELRFFSDCISLDKAQEIMNENSKNPQASQAG